MCSVDECCLPTFCRGMCSKHYYRVRRTGTTDPGPLAPAPTATRFTRYAVPVATDWATLGGVLSCWYWSGRHWRGRPRFTAEGRNQLAYRWVLGWQIGRPLDGWEEAHHVCEDRRCVNPLHMRLMTVEEHREEHYRPGDLTALDVAENF